VFIVEKVSMITDKYFKVTLDLDGSSPNPAKSIYAAQHRCVVDDDYSDFISDFYGSPVNITGYTILFTVKRQVDLDKSDDSALITKTITKHTDPTGGISALVLTNSQTNIEAGIYYYDLRLILGGIITQTERDKVEIVESVTKRT
jgi:hypothetical protein